MKTIFSSMKHSYLAKIGMLLIAVALVAGIISCNGIGVVTYSLTMAENPVAGGTATDLTGASPYKALTAVNISAVANTGYQFVEWSKTAGLFGDKNAAQTTFIMPAEDVTVTANFELAPIDHFKIYQYDYFIPPYIGEDVYLEDQFVTINATVGYAGQFANPVEKVHDEVTTPISCPDHHFMVYLLDYEGEPQKWQVTVSNQFGTQNLTVVGPVSLCVPTQKEGHEPPVGLDHYLLYEVEESTYVEEEIKVSLKDQFISEPAVYDMYEPCFFANPVRKTHGSEVTEIIHPDVHAVIYDVWSEGEDFETTVQVDNQFGQLDFDIYQDEWSMLAVPSEKKSVEQPLNHFKSYWVDEMSPIGKVVQLEDQFVTITANVTWAALFANPVEKQAGIEFSELSPIWDPRDHLMFYGIDILEGEGGEWQVVVDNQFGTGQWLRVAGPIMVIVPTEKIPHGPAEDLNHFLVYEVLDWEITPYEEVLLWDQFTPEGPEFNTVESPMLFAVPAHKTVPGSDPTPIIGDEHLLFYWIDGGLGFWEPIVYNQFFGPEPIPVYQGDGDWFPPFDLLGVPSEKTWWNPWEPE